MKLLSCQFFNPRHDGQCVEVVNMGQGCPSKALVETLFVVSIFSSIIELSLYNPYITPIEPQYNPDVTPM